MPFSLVFFLFLLPWLNPFAPGPSPAVNPLIFSWFCGCAFVAAWSCWQIQFGARINTPAIALAWMAAALFNALFGLLQYFGEAAVFSPWVNSTEVGMAYGNLRQRNLFASLINIGLAALIWFADGRESSQAGQKSGDQLSTGPMPPMMSTPTLLVAAAILGTANSASASRTGTLQLALVVCLFGVWRLLNHKTIRSLLVVAVVAYFLASLVLPLLAGMGFGDSGILGRMKEKPLQCASRLVLWSNVLHLIAQKPWLGWGWGNLDYAHFVTLYPGERFCDILDNAHNLPLHLAVELGVPASLLICGTGLWLIFRARPWREQDATRQMAWGVMAVILLHSMVEYPLWYGPFQIAFGLCIALLWQPDWGKYWPQVRVTIGMFAFVFIACIGYASWDYHRISQIYMIPKMRDAAYREDTFDKVKDSWLFQNQIKFAELTTTAVTQDNASHLNEIAHELLHFSPEAKVAIKLIESAMLLGHDQEAKYFLLRLQAAFPADYAKWILKNPG